MSNIVTLAFKKYPVTIMLSTGVFFWMLKYNMIGTVYENEYSHFDKERM